MSTNLEITLTCTFLVHVTQTRANGKTAERDFMRPLRIRGTAGAVAKALPVEAADLINAIITDLDAADLRASKGFAWRFPRLLPVGDSAAPTPPPIPALTAAQLDEYNRTMGNEGT